jgi:hypothetical protein
VTTLVLVAPSVDDERGDELPVVEVLPAGMAREDVDSWALELATERGSCAVVRRPAEMALATGERRPVTRHYSNGYACAWCASPIHDGDAGCANPACLTGMDAGHVTTALERMLDAERGRQEDLRRAAVWREQAAEARVRREERWGELTGEAARRGACLECLRASSWEHGDPRYVRHRVACPRERQRPGA